MQILSMIQILSGCVVRPLMWQMFRRTAFNFAYLCLSFTLKQHRQQDT
jgi:hypothetical protein